VAGVGFIQHVFHRAALDAGCKDYSAPGLRPHLDDPDAFVWFRLNHGENAVGADST
jgi:hypothetical protein